MPVLDAKALKSDPDGLAFLRDVLRPAGAGAEKAAPAPQTPLRRSRKPHLKASSPTHPFEPPQAP